MALEDAEEATAIVSFLTWETDSAENGGLIKGSELELKFEAMEEHASEPAALADTYASTGVNVVKVTWTEDYIDYDLYYSFNLGIDADPWVDTSSDTFVASAGGEYPVEYKAAEKTALLSQYKRYVVAGTSGATFSDALAESISDIVEYTIGSAVTAENLMNFKRSNMPEIQTKEISIFSVEDIVRTSDLSATTTAIESMGENSDIMSNVRSTLGLTYDSGGY